VQILDRVERRPDLAKRCGDVSVAKCFPGLPETRRRASQQCAEETLLIDLSSRKGMDLWRRQSVSEDDVPTAVPVERPRKR
jgi:hypothetical protein